MKHKKKLLRIIATMLVFVLVMGLVPVSAASTKVVTVSTKKSLVSAMKNPNVSPIIYANDTSTGFVIPDVVGANNKKLIIRAQKAKIYNEALFKSIVIDDCALFTERRSEITINVNDADASIVIASKAKVNTLNVTTSEVSIDVKKNAAIDNLICKKKNAEVLLNVGRNSEVNVYVNKITDIDVDGNKNSVVNIINSAKNSTISSKIPMSLETVKKVNLTLEAGSEGSTVKTSADSVNICGSCNDI